MTSQAVGIDLGTTNSSVAVFKNGHVEIIKNIYSNPVTPSCVSFTEDGEILVGQGAQEKICSNPKNTVFGVKRLIGRRITDADVQEDIKLWPFKVVANPGEDKPLIQVKFKGQEQRYTAEYISSLVLNDLKMTAENYLGHEVTDAVITIPANYGTAQRRATDNAAKLAGFIKVSFLNEPTAAAVAYGTENLRGRNQTVMVFDMGGGTCDVSILDLNPQHVYKVKGTAGDMHLGGDDLDKCLMEYFAIEFQNKHKKNLKTDPKAVWKLKTKCESVKRTLSRSKLYSFDIDSLFDGKDFLTSLSREKLEEICKPVLMKILLPIKQALKNADLEKQAIDTVVLTGGSSRVPKIEELVKDFFNGKQLSKSIDAEEAIVRGAAMMAAQQRVNGSVVVGLLVVRLEDILGVSLGIDTYSGRMSFFLPHGTALPAKTSKRLVTSVDYTKSCTFPVYEGNSETTKDNKFLGNFEIRDIPQKLKGEVKFDCFMEIDVNGMLHVSAVETSTGKSGQITFSNYIA